MARIRSVHPGLFTDEAFVSVSPLARLLLIGLWTEADDQGVFEWKPITMKMRLLPVDNADVPSLLAELVEVNSVRSFQHGGRAYGAIRNFQRFQRPKKPNAVHPLPGTMHAYVGRAGESGSEPDAPEDDDSSEMSTPHGAGSSPPPVAESARFGERAEAQGSGGGEPEALERASVPPKGEKSPQMEDGGWKREEESPSSLRSDGAGGDPPPPPDARTVLWSEGLARFRRMTGKADGPARGQLGRWLKLTRDDCALLSRVLFEAEDARPGDPVAWVEGAIRHRMGQSGGPAPAKPSGHDKARAFADHLFGHDQGHAA